MYAAESGEEISEALAALGWESRKSGRKSGRKGAREGDGSGAIIGACDKHYIMVNFSEGEPTSVIISYVGKGGGILSSKWESAARLPAPRQAIRALSSATKPR